MSMNFIEILRQYFITYFIVLFIPLVICCSYYIRMLYVIGEDDIREKKTELIHSVEFVENFIGELESFADNTEDEVDAICEAIEKAVDKIRS